MQEPEVMNDRTELVVRHTFYEKPKKRFFFNFIFTWNWLIAEFWVEAEITLSQNKTRKLISVRMELA